MGQAWPVAGLGRSHSVNALLQEGLLRTQQAEQPFQAILFEFQELDQAFRISYAVGFPSDHVERVRDVLVFRVGDERGFVGLVAETRRALYLPECTSEPRWITKGPTQSAYFVPVVVGDDVPFVLSVASPLRDGIDSQTRAI